jgi:membrane protein DedA with SNARE-associated domain
MSALDVAMPLGYVVLPAAVAAESAGVPVPGETTLIAAAILAAHGHMHIALVIALAAIGAIAGDNLGYLLGRRLGRPVLLASGPARRLRRSALRAAESLFARYGGGAVLVGRFVGIGRIAIAWLAGADEMPWRRFALWNAAGSTAWAALVGGLAYAAGAAGAHWLAVAGAAAGLAAVVHLSLTSHRDRRASPGDVRQGPPPP